MTDKKITPANPESIAASSDDAKALETRTTARQAKRSTLRQAKRSTLRTTKRQSGN